MIAAARVTLLGAMLLISPQVFAQGCSQCAQTVGQTPTPTRQAYRRAIILMVVAGTGVFAAGVTAIRRFR